jgi:hypothetical protein
MSDHILTRDLQDYLLVTAVALGVGGSTVATRFHQRWLAKRHMSFTVVYSVTLIVAITCGTLALRTIPLLLPPLLHVPIDLGLGFIIGRGAFAIDRAINRRWQRSDRGRPTQPVAPRTEQRVWRATEAVTRAPTGEPESRTNLVLIAVLEEAVFRGVLVRAALSVSSVPLTIALLGGIAGVFALEHLPFGWSHVAGKIPFSIAVTAGAVLLGSSIMPIVAHTTLNLLVFRYLQETRRLSVNRMAPVRGPF